MTKNTIKVVLFIIGFAFATYKIANIEPLDEKEYKKRYN